MSGEAKRDAAAAADAANKALSFTNKVIEGREISERVALSSETGADMVRAGLETMSGAIQAGGNANHDIIEDAREVEDILDKLGPEAAPVLEAVHMAVLHTESLRDQIIAPTEDASRTAEGTAEWIASLARPLATLEDVANGSRADLFLGEALTREVGRDL